MALSNAQRLINLGTPPEQAKELSRQIDGGSITPQPAIANLAGDADIATTVTKVNAILAALRLAGVIAT
jgi:hypothetical protein